jgi:5-methyltetrahydrofolate--homocysteine methyltransferase
MGPTNRPLSLAGAAAHAAGRAVNFDQVRDAYGEQVRGLLDGGVDLLLLETIVDALNATAAILAITAECDRRGVQVPLMLSVTPPAGSDRLLSGETLEAFYASVRDARPFSVGVNYGMGAAGMQTHLATLARVPGAFVACCPNAGLPNAFGDYDDTPAITARWLHEFAATGLVNIVGGCCGTTPEYIPAIAAAVEGLQPRRIPAVEA